MPFPMSAAGPATTHVNATQLRDELTKTEQNVGLMLSEFLGQVRQEIQQFAESQQLSLREAMETQRQALHDEIASWRTSSQESTSAGPAEDEDEPTDEASDAEEEAQPPTAPEETEEPGAEDAEEEAPPAVPQEPQPAAPGEQVPEEDLAAPEEASEESPAPKTEPPASQTPPTKTASDDSEPDMPRNLGSLLHGAGKCRPCLYFAKGRCAPPAGGDCMFCHFEHSRRRSKKGRGARDRQGACSSSRASPSSSGTSSFSPPWAAAPQPQALEMSHLSHRFELDVDSAAEDLEVPVLTPAFPSANAWNQTFFWADGEEASGAAWREETSWREDTPWPSEQARPEDRRHHTNPTPPPPELEEEMELCEYEEPPPPPPRQMHPRYEECPLFAEEQAPSPPGSQGSPPCPFRQEELGEEEVQEPLEIYEATPPPSPRHFFHQHFAPAPGPAQVYPLLFYQAPEQPQARGSGQEPPPVHLQGVAVYPQLVTDPALAHQPSHSGSLALQPTQGGLWLPQQPDIPVQSDTFSVPDRGPQPGSSWESFAHWY